MPQILALICLLCKKRAKISSNINYAQCCFWNQEFYNIKRRAQKVHICEFKNYINNRANVSELTKCLDVTIWCKGLTIFPRTAARTCSRIVLTDVVSVSVYIIYHNRDSKLLNTIWSHVHYLKSERKKKTHGNMFSIVTCAAMVFNLWQYSKILPKIKEHQREEGIQTAEYVF